MLTFEYCILYETIQFFLLFFSIFCTCTYYSSAVGTSFIQHCIVRRKYYRLMVSVRVARDECNGLEIITSNFCSNSSFIFKGIFRRFFSSLFRPSSRSSFRFPIIYRSVYTIQQQRGDRWEENTKHFVHNIFASNYPFLWNFFSFSNSHTSTC